MHGLSGCNRSAWIFHLAGPASDDGTSACRSDPRAASRISSPKIPLSRGICTACVHRLSRARVTSLRSARERSISRQQDSGFLSGHFAKSTCRYRLHSFVVGRRQQFWSAIGQVRPRQGAAHRIDIRSPGPDAGWYSDFEILQPAARGMMSEFALSCDNWGIGWLQITNVSLRPGRRGRQYADIEYDDGVPHLNRPPRESCEIDGLNADYVDVYDAINNGWQVGKANWHKVTRGQATGGNLRPPPR